MQCDKCHANIEEDDTYERILCGHCHRHEELPPDVHCAACGVTVRWTKTLEELKRVARRVRWMKYPAWTAFFLAIAAFEWRNLMFTQILLGIGVVIIGLFLFIVAALIAFPGVYGLGWTVGKKFLKWDMPDISEGPAGIFTWIFGVFVLSLPVLIWLLGLLFRSVGGHFTG